jgi:transcriptional regulator NrdR family protein
MNQEPNPFGLPCPGCGSYQVRVIDTRSSRFSSSKTGPITVDPRIRRRRACIACGKRFSTEERYRDADAKSDQPSLAARLREIARQLDDASTADRT